MRLTVILTTYNHQRYIAQAIDSVLMQETDFPYKLVVIDDCSQDGTREIITDYARRHPAQLRTVLLPENRCDNRAFARVYGQTRSDYVAMLDGDDYWTSPDKLQRQVTFLDEYRNCPICFHNVTVVEANGTPTGVLNAPEQKQFSTFDDLLQYTFIAGCSAVLRRAAVERLPSWYDTALVGDLPLYLLHALDGRIGYLDGVMGAYRLHHGGFWSGRSRRQQLELLCELYTELADVLPVRHRSKFLAHAARWTSLLDVERHRDAESQTRRRVCCGYHEAQAIRKALDATVPSDATVGVVTQGNAALLELGDRPAVHFGGPGTGPEVLFAQGEEGTATAPWISEGSAYDFRLYGGQDRTRPLAEVSVVRGETAILPRRCDDQGAGAFVSATPNPLAAGPGLGATTISWATRAATGGQVYLAVRALDTYLPRDDAAALRYAVELAGDGVRYFVLPAAARWWLAAFPSLGRHLEEDCAVLGRLEACTVYRLPGGTPA